MYCKSGGRDGNQLDLGLLWCFPVIFKPQRNLQGFPVRGSGLFCVLWLVCLLLFIVLVLVVFLLLCLGELWYMWYSSTTPKYELAQSLSSAMFATQLPRIMKADWTQYPHVSSCQSCGWWKKHFIIYIYISLIISCSAAPMSIFTANEKVRSHSVKREWFQSCWWFYRWYWYIYRATEHLYDRAAVFGRDRWHVLGQIRPLLRLQRPGDIWESHSDLVFELGT
jgi:hypothetical protein